LYRLHPSWQAVRDLVGSGRIGRLMAVHSWFSYFNDDPTNIRNIHEAGGGALFDIGCYCVNLSRMLFGQEPARVEASIRRDAEARVDVVTSALPGFGAGGLGTFPCSTPPEPNQRAESSGTDGRTPMGIPST